ncbi:major facilitator superfamily domain-containing protein [Microdochium trichocladiopsis]|uniref:Major facilitator superfamily domain-containing protein n=1 Tax=Microdochium trichocladiopsis TaxID=1682393 RepID=A0A9P8Y7N8_9PEZI|nr:major facilitator superfamily domain-containing protein [Microdochium trichocladiopsis]KAH7029587.1 major facilitator superfamily domain-containing protein [Microdochium trichocladiopsis]
MSDHEKTSAIGVEQAETDTNPVTKSQTVDTLHHDEGLRVLANYNGDPHWEESEEKKLRRKVDWKLMPVLCVTYGLQYYDKAMLSQAALFGLRTDLELTVGDRYSFSAAIFYLGFIIGAYPAMWLAQRYPIDRVASGLVVVWGICLILTSACTSWQGLYAQRFFLGFLESGISPLFMLIVGSWYRKNEQALRMGIWYSCTGYASCVSPLINYGLGLINGGVSSWRYMYYFAGALTIVWGALLYFILPPDPVHAKGFDERERYILVSRLRTNNAGVRNTHFKFEQVVELLLDLKFWIVFSIGFLSMISNGPISTFIPIIINGFGFTTLQSLLLVIPAGAYAGTLQLLLPYLAYKHNGLRSSLILLAQLGTTLAALLLWLLPLSAKGALLFACYILPSVGGGYAVLMGLSIANTAGYTKRSVQSSGLYIGYCLGNFVGPLVFKKEDAPRYPSGFLIVVITALIAGLLAPVYRLLCMWDNKRRDKAGVMEGFDNAYDDDLTDVKRSKRKRAELVCVACHAKKVKCDLQARSKRGFADCTACGTTARECTVRTSRRGRWQQRSAPRSQNDGAAPSDVGVVAAAPLPPAEPPSCDPPPPPPLPPPQAAGPATATPQSQHSQTSNSQTLTGDVDTGFLQVYRVENQSDAQRQELETCLEQRQHMAQPCPIDEELQQSFSETYWENCYAWCPVIDRERLFDDVANSQLLAYALALASSHIQPPLVPHEGPATYYKKARELLYGDEEPDKLTELRAIALFYWWAPRAPTIAHRHSSWWWTSVIIRQAQQMSLHREPRPDHAIADQYELSLRRRVWWTAFARERLTALCQSKPCIIDPADCNILEPTLADFARDAGSQKKGSIFIHWVRLCAIIGDIAKALSRTAQSSPPRPFPHDLRQRLIDWIQSLPPALQLPIGSARTVSFDRDVHQLHLPYLTTIIVLHLQRSAHALPQALPPAILAASCIARILKDTLARGNTRFLMAITCWYAATAFTALLQACRIAHLSRDANECLDILVRAVEQLQHMWGTANVIRQGFTRLREQSESYNKPFQSNSAAAMAAQLGGGAAANITSIGGGTNGLTNGPPGNDGRNVCAGVVSAMGDAASSSFGSAAVVPAPPTVAGFHDLMGEDFDWTELFPFVTRATGGIADSLLGDREQGIPTRGLPSPENMLFQDTLMTQYQNLLEPFGDYFFNIPYMGLG